MDAPALNALAGLLLLNCLFSAEASGQLPAMSRRKVHLYLLAGQSNMAGRGAAADADRQPHPRVWVLDRDGRWAPATEPLHFDKPEVVGVGPGLAFGRRMAEEDSSVLIGLIPAAVGGSGIDSWQPGGYHGPTKRHPYDDAVRRTKAAQKAGTLRGVLWHQGESDSQPELAATYADKLRRLVRRFRRELGVRRVPVVVGTLGDFYVARTPSAATVNEALRNAANRERRVACVEATGLTDTGDQTHFDAPSARELGRRYANAMRQLRSPTR
ncbi:MAG: sialate O-acetylesterase [Ferruginibacter sp.]|nr:sialate O-acetylesterase [Cytophagales bacterium]